MVTESGRLEALGSAAAGVAHDINNELTLMLNHLAMADQNTPRVQALRAAATRCAALTSGLLSYCRGDAPAMQSVEPCEFLRRYANSVEMPEAVHLRLDLPGALPALYADPAALRRVLDNLIANACHAMNQAGHVTLRAFGTVIQVEDSGPGVEPASRSRVFQPFFTTKGSAGTGLGLAIVRDLMAQQGGAVSLLSEAGCGACFELRFRPVVS